MGGWGLMLEEGILQEIPPGAAQLRHPTTSLLRPGSTGLGTLAVGCPFPTLTPFLCPAGRRVVPLAGDVCPEWQRMKGLERPLRTVSNAPSCK